MGCDIHLQAHKLHKEGTYTVLDFVPFNWRSYIIFGFLANVRNCSCVPPIVERRGLPEWVTNDKELRERTTPIKYDGTPDYPDFGDHSHSYLMVDELLNFDYEGKFEDRWCSTRIGGSNTCEVGQGKIVTFREFLGKAFFEDLEKLKYSGADAIVFGFGS